MLFKDFIADPEAYFEFSWWQSPTACGGSTGTSTLRLVVYSPVTGTETSFVWRVQRLGRVEGCWLRCLGVRLQPSGR